MQVVQALVLAGGEGTRLRPFTSDLPKPMIPVLGKPLLQWRLEFLKKHGVKKVILAVGYRGDQIKEFFGNGEQLGLQIEYVVEPEPLGTAGCLRLAKDLLDEHFFMTNGDEITDLDLGEMQEFHFGKKSVSTIFLHELDDVKGFGVVELAGDRVKSFIEKPAAGEAKSNLINGGIYLLSKQVIDFVGEGKQSIERNVFPRLAQEGLLHGFRSGKKVFWTTVNTLEDLQETEAQLNKAVI